MTPDEQAFEERAALIARLERENDEQQRNLELARARYEHGQDALNAAMSIYIDQLTAPLRAFIEELRR